jgi:hypothetical protein
MKQLLIIIALAGLLSGCGGGPAPFSGSVRNLAPPQVGEFKLAGEVKAVDVGPRDKYRSGPVPTEGISARYEAAGKTPLYFQLINYQSAADAEQAFNLWKENVPRLGNGAKYSETNVGAGKPRRGIMIEGLAPGMNQAVWVDGSLLYHVAGANLQSIQAFEQSLP